MSPTTAPSGRYPSHSELGIVSYYLFETSCFHDIPLERNKGGNIERFSF